MPDLDQGGVATQLYRIYYGPTIGWLNTPVNVLTIVGTTQLVTVGGTTTVTAGVSAVQVNFSGAVTLQLPSSAFQTRPIVIADTGGFAGTNNITILPFGTDRIMGLLSIAITANFGSFTLLPIVGGVGWVAE